MWILVKSAGLPRRISHPGLLRVWEERESGCKLLATAIMGRWVTEHHLKHHRSTEGRRVGDCTAHGRRGGTSTGVEDTSFHAMWLWSDDGDKWRWWRHAIQSYVSCLLSIQLWRSSLELTLSIASLLLRHCCCRLNWVITLREVTTGMMPTGVPDLHRPAAFYLEHFLCSECIGWL